MSWFPSFDRRKAELDEEIRAHLAMDAADRIGRGQSPNEAESAARRQFGNVDLVRDSTHGQWRWRRLERFVQDLRYALRVLRRSPGFSLTVILTLAVGVGAACAMFTVVDRVLLRSLPYRDPSRLVEIHEAGTSGKVTYGVPWLDIEQWRQRARSLSAIAFYSSNEKRVSFLEARGGTTHVIEAATSANLFELLGFHPSLGRGFAQQDAGGSVLPSDADTVILSDAAWRTGFGADPAIIGRVVGLNGQHLTVLGVMPRGFTFPFSNDVPAIWRPIVLTPEDKTRQPDDRPTNHQAPVYQVLARLRDGANLAAADSELKAIQTDVARAYSEDERDDASSIQLDRYQDTLVKSDLRKALLALFGAAAMLWLIACLNVTSLMLARATGRQREIAVRGALGASRWQIVRQLLLEGLLLSAAASLVGLALAVGILKLFQHALVTQFEMHQQLRPDLPVLGALLALTILSALLISAWPALGAARASIERALRQGAPQQGVSKAHHRLRALMVVTEIALSLTLLVGCGLLLRTIYALRHVPLGFHTDHVMVASMAIPAYKFAGNNMTTELYQPLLERVKHLPGVDSAALLTEVPLGKTFQMIFTFGRASKSVDDIRRASMESQFRVVDPDAQRVLGFHMLRGRFFNSSDTATSQAVVVVNPAFVREYFGDDRDPGSILGVPLMNLSKNRRAVVVGVIEPERQVSVAEPSKPELQVCLPQITTDSFLYMASEGHSMDLAVRIDGDPQPVIARIREVMRAASPDLAASTFTTMDQVVEDSFGSQNLAARLLEIFGGSALLLCLSGIYGLLAYLVAQRRREMGVRIALGAQKHHVMGLVLRQAGWMLAVGLILGLALAYATGSALRTFLYGVQADDRWTMAAVTAVLFLGGLAASLLPARRAASVDPMEALRAE
jgi:predicted permease